MRGVFVKLIFEPIIVNYLKEVIQLCQIQVDFKKSLKDKCLIHVIFKNLSIILCNSAKRRSIKVCFSVSKVNLCKISTSPSAFLDTVTLTTEYLLTYLMAGEGAIKTLPINGVNEYIPYHNSQGLSINHTVFISLN